MNGRRRRRRRDDDHTEMLPMNPTATTPPPDDDVVDRVAVLADGSALQLLRRERDKVRQATQGSYAALFDPALPGLTLADRLLVALSASRLTPVPALAAHYRERLERQRVDAGSMDPKALHAAAGTGPVEAASPRLQALLVFARTLIERPIDGDRTALRRLQAAGVDTPTVVTLAQLIAFVSYQARLVAALEAMRAQTAPEDAGHPTPPHARSASANAPVPADGFTMQALGWKSWLEVVDPARASPAQIAVLEESHPQAKVSEYYLTLVHQPEILRQRSAAFNAIMYSPGGLPRAERELSATVVSRINGCVYCASVHAQRFEQLAKRRDVIEQIFAEPHGAGTNGREKAIVDFSIALTAQPHRPAGADIEALRQAGLAPLEILDLVHSVAIFAWANRLMLSLGEPVRPSPAHG